jgi:hypothetical protein
VSGRLFGGVDLNAYSFTAGADYGIHAATLTGFSGDSTGALRDIVALGGTTMLQTEDKDGAIGTTSNTGDTIVAIVDLDPNGDAPEWNVIAGIGVFTGSFIIKL